MVLNDPAGTRLLPAAAGAPGWNVLWHDLECGGYLADLPLWQELAQAAESSPPPTPILEIGAGTGRVTLELARSGRSVTALDRDPELLEALRTRRGGLDVETVCVDARTFELARRDFALCIVPMQTAQLLGGAPGRAAFLRRARAHLRPGGTLACAIVTDFEAFDCADGNGGSTAAIARLDGSLYLSRATRVSVERHNVRIERERRVLPEEGAEPAGLAQRSRPAERRPPAGGVLERDVTELDRLSVAGLEREALAAGLHPAGTSTIATTEEHVASTVVMLRA